MPCPRYIATPTKKEIVRSRESGEKVGEIAKRFQIGLRTVSRLCKRAKEEGNVSRRDKTGRPRKILEDQERRLILPVRRDQNKSATDVVANANEVLGVKISKWTARRILKRRGLYARRPARKPLIQEKHRRTGASFQRSTNIGTKQIGPVLWSDETKINLYNPDGGFFVRRPMGSRFVSKYTRATVKFGGGNIMVWGNMSL